MILLSVCGGGGVQIIWAEPDVCCVCAPIIWLIVNFCVVFIEGDRRYAFSGFYLMAHAGLENSLLSEQSFETGAGICWAPGSQSGAEY